MCDALAYSRHGGVFGVQAHMGCKHAWAASAHVMPTCQKFVGSLECKKDCDPILGGAIENPRRILHLMKDPTKSQGLAVRVNRKAAETSGALLPVLSLFSTERAQRGRAASADQAALLAACSADA